MADTRVHSSGVGFFGILGIVFITLKLCGVINWPWIWVLSPLWGSALLFIVVITFLLIFVFGVKAWLDK